MLKNLRNVLFGLCCITLMLASSASFAVSSATYTYLRCFYQGNPSNLTPATTYVWALETNSNDYFRVSGYWNSSDPLSVTNMFYSDISQETLLSKCQDTLKNQGIDAPVAMYAGSDSAASLNYTVWSIDSPVQDKTINKIISFGDSLSDIQNMYNATQWRIPNSTNYFAGRFSNGKNWLDYLSSSLRLPLYNWAVAGAAADNYLVIPGVNAQVSSWITYMQNAPNYQPANSIFTFLVGGNDLVNYNRSVETIITGELQALTKLITAGGKNILLANLPDVSRTPAFSFREDAAFVHAQVIKFNQQLAQLVSNLQATYGSSINIQLFDTYTLFDNLMDNPGNYGFNNTTQSCLDINSSKATNYLFTWAPRSNCTDANTFVFWDLLHPTSHTHQLLADFVAEFIQSKF